jgi:glycosyltransferase involved in cell wall biosynthesis
MAAGKPVLALRRGGAVETVIEGRTGVLYDQPTPEAFLDAVGRLSAGRWDPASARARAHQFSRSRFAARIDQSVAFAIEQGASVFF